MTSQKYNDMIWLENHWNCRGQKGRIRLINVTEQATTNYLQFGSTVLGICPGFGGRLLLSSHIRVIYILKC